MADYSKTSSKIHISQILFPLCLCVAQCVHWDTCKLSSLTDSSQTRLMHLMRAGGCKYISQWFMLRSCRIGFTVNTTRAATWDAGGLVRYTNASKWWIKNEIPISHFLLSPELGITFWATSQFLLHFFPHEHLCCVCHVPVSKPDSADHTGMGLITSANNTSKSDCKDPQPWIRVIIKDFDKKKKKSIYCRTPRYIIYGRYVSCYVVLIAKFPDSRWNGW